MVNPAIWNHRNNIKENVFNRSKWIDSFTENGRHFDRNKKTDYRQIRQVIVVSNECENESCKGTKFRCCRQFDQLIFERFPSPQNKSENKFNKRLTKELMWLQFSAWLCSNLPSTLLSSSIQNLQKFLRRSCCTIFGTFIFKL